ncbi:MAG: hypothetical protein ACRCR9_00150 [Chitinophagaceae bacterium]
MGSVELAANLFRIALTKNKIVENNVHGQKALEKTHKGVGSAVRKMVKEQTGKYPEQLPVLKELPKIKTEVKKLKKVVVFLANFAYINMQGLLWQEISIKRLITSISCICI